MRSISLVFAVIVAVTLGSIGHLNGQTTGGNSRVPPVPSMFGQKSQVARPGASTAAKRGTGPSRAGALTYPDDCAARRCR